MKGPGSDNLRLTGQTNFIIVFEEHRQIIPPNPVAALEQFFAVESAQRGEGDIVQHRPFHHARQPTRPARGFAAAMDNFKRRGRPFNDGDFIVDVFHKALSYHNP